MEPFASAAAHRRLVVDVLLLCVDRSSLRDRLDPAAVRPTIDAAMGEMWRGDELNLEPLWKILTEVPELDKRDAAVPLVAFSTFAADLDLTILLPEALRTMPEERRIELRDYLKLGEDHVRMMRAHQEQLARKTAERQGRISKEVPVVAPRTGSKEVPALRRDSKRRSSKEVSAAATRRTSSREVPAVVPRQLVIGGIVGACVLAGGAALVSVGFVSPTLPDFDPQTPYDVSDVEEVLKLQSGHRDGFVMAAAVAEPKWQAMLPSQKELLAVKVFEVEEPKGVHLLKLSDGSGSVVVVDDRSGRKLVTTRWAR